MIYFFFFFQAEDGIRDKLVTGVQTCALPISHAAADDFLPVARREDAYDLAVPAPGPDHPARAALLDTVHDVAPLHQHLARDDDDAIHGHYVHLLCRLPVHHFGPGVHAGAEVV